MDYPQTLPPAAQRVLAGVLKVAPKSVVRQMLRNMSTGDASGPLSRFDADRLAREAPTAAILARPAVAPTRWPDPNKTPASAGPLQGATVIVKESLDVAGLPQSLGNHGAKGPIAPKDSVLVARIRKAGGKLLGKSIMTELGMDGVGVHLENGVPDNPRVKGHFPGGSSTGTAVLVASGQARFGVGGDGLGSVRIPSGFCGLVGLKPTHGRLSVVGMQRDAPTLAVPGPMTRNATDCALLWAVLDGHKPTHLRPLWPTSIGVMNQLPPSLASTDVRGAFDRALALLGCPEVKVDVEGAGSSTTLAFMSATYETARSPWAKLAQEPTPQLVLAMGQRLDEKDSGWTKTQRKKLRDVFLKALDRAGGFILSPTTAIPAPAIDKQLLKGGMNLALLRAVGCYAPLANVTGVPAIAIPCGVDARGRPLSVQVFGKPDSEGDLLRIARAFEVL